MDHRQQSRILLVGAFLVILICCGSICFCGITADRWLPGVIVSLIHPREPWPVADDYIWKNDLDDIIAVAPVVADGQVYVENNNGLAAINQQTGSLKWQRKIDLTSIRFARHLKNRIIRIQVSLAT